MRGWNDAVKVMEGKRKPYSNPDKKTWAALGYRDALRRKTSKEHVWQKHLSEISIEYGLVGRISDSAIRRKPQ